MLNLMDCMCKVYTQLCFHNGSCDMTLVACVSGQDTVHYRAANGIRNSHYTSLGNPFVDWIIYCIITNNQSKQPRWNDESTWYGYKLHKINIIICINGHVTGQQRTYSSIAKFHLRITKIWSFLEPYIGTISIPSDLHPPNWCKSQNHGELNIVQYCAGFILTQLHSKVWCKLL